MSSVCRSVAGYYSQAVSSQSKVQLEVPCGVNDPALGDKLEVLNFFITWSRKWLIWGQKEHPCTLCFACFCFQNVITFPKHIRRSSVSQDTYKRKVNTKVELSGVGFLVPGTERPLLPPGTTLTGNKLWFIVVCISTKAWSLWRLCKSDRWCMKKKKKKKRNNVIAEHHQTRNTCRS